eukprot:9476682-Pyramimonas_sp.AAC.1
MHKLQAGVWHEWRWRRRSGRRATSCSDSGHDQSDEGVRLGGAEPEFRDLSSLVFTDDEEVALP